MDADQAVVVNAHGPPNVSDLQLSKVPASIASGKKPRQLMSKHLEGQQLRTFRTEEESSEDFRAEE